LEREVWGGVRISIKTHQQIFQKFIIMKNTLLELDVDFVGGQDPLTAEEQKLGRQRSATKEGCG
jgi:hypothetical protein